MSKTVEVNVPEGLRGKIPEQVDTSRPADVRHVEEAISRETGAPARVKLNESTGKADVLKFIRD